jgi:flagellar capping protein FliD
VSVASLFTDGEHGEGVAGRLSRAVKGFQDPQSGAISTRLKGLDRSIKDQDAQIDRQNDRLADKEAQLKRQFADLEKRTTSLNAQGDFLAQRLGGEGQAA